MFMRYDEVKYWMPCAEALEHFHAHFPDGADHESVIAAFNDAGRPDWAQYVMDHLLAATPATEQ
jgi:hypothetical protein